MGGWTDRALRPWRSRRGKDAESGQVMLLGIACCALALAMIGVGSSAAALYLERKALWALADSAAAVAANQPDLSGVYDGRGPGGPLLTDASVWAAVEGHLASAPASVVLRHDALAISSPTGAPDGASAQVTLSAVARPPFVPWALLPWTDGIAITVTSTARLG